MVSCHPINAFIVQRKINLLCVLCILLGFISSASAQSKDELSALAIINGQRIITLKEVDDSIASQLFGLPQ